MFHFFLFCLMLANTQSLQSALAQTRPAQSHKKNWIIGASVATAAVITVVGATLWYRNIYLPRILDESIKKIKEEQDRKISQSLAERKRQEAKRRQAEVETKRVADEAMLNRQQEVARIRQEQESKKRAQATTAKPVVPLTASSTTSTDLADSKREADATTTIRQLQGDVERKRAHDVVQTGDTVSIYRKTGIGVAHEKGDRTTNEDRYVVRVFDGYTVCIVADGHSGDEAAEYTREHLSDHLCLIIDKLGGSASEEAVKKALCDAIEEFDRKLILDLNKRNLIQKSTGQISIYYPPLLRPRYPGTTLVVAIIREDSVDVLHVGDSRAILCDMETRAVVAATQDHSLTTNTAELQRVTELQALTHGEYIFTYKPGDTIYLQDPTTGTRAEFSRALGDAQYKVTQPQALLSTPDFMRIKRNTKNNYLLMATDGLWKRDPSGKTKKGYHMCSNEDVVNVIHAQLQINPDLRLAAESAVNDAIAKDCGDNVTMLIIPLSTSRVAI